MKSNSNYHMSQLVIKTFFEMLSILVRLQVLFSWRAHSFLKLTYIFAKMLKKLTWIPAPNIDYEQKKVLKCTCGQKRFT